nr:PREDICTED: olfactory receptor 6S1-like [Latimeria chalumnae]|eukprot:XP_014354060.1 PREDICTED: olfactory receptor 6S1-like [Latimeria chalumnae]
MNTTSKVLLTSNLSAEADRGSLDTKATVKLCSVLFTLCFINYINGVLIVTFFRVPTFRETPRYVLFINLIINDTIQLSFILLIRPSASACLPLHQLNTPFILAVMALERYLAICNPLRHPELCTVQRVYKAIALIWVLGAVPSTSDVVIVLAIEPGGYKASMRCQRSLLIRAPYQIMKGTVFYVTYITLVWLVMMYTYIRIALVARATTAEKSTAQKARNTILLHALHVVLSMLSFLIPYLDRLLQGSTKPLYVDLRYANFYFLLVIPRFISPIIYGLRDERYRKHLRRYFKCKAAGVQSATGT